MLHCHGFPSCNARFTLRTLSSSRACHTTLWSYVHTAPGEPSTAPPLCIDLLASPQEGTTPLHDALSFGHIEVARALVEKGGVGLLYAIDQRVRLRLLADATSLAFCAMSALWFCMVYTRHWSFCDACLHDESDWKCLTLHHFVFWFHADLRQLFACDWSTRLQVIMTLQSKHLARSKRLLQW